MGGSGWTAADGSNGDSKNIVDNGRYHGEYFGNTGLGDWETFDTERRNVGYGNGLGFPRIAEPEQTSKYG